MEVQCTQHRYLSPSFHPSFNYKVTQKCFSVLTSDPQKIQRYIWMVITRGASRGGLEGLSPSPHPRTPQMKWHYIQGCMESRAILSPGQPPLLPPHFEKSCYAPGNYVSCKSVPSHRLGLLVGWAELMK